VRYEARTQKELDAALEKAGVGDIVVVLGDGWFRVDGSKSVEAWGSSHVVARGSSHVEAWGSSHVVAWGSSHVEAWGSSHVEARESSHVVARESSHVVARESSHVEAWGSSHVVASKFASVTVDRNSADNAAVVSGGVLIEIPAISTAEDWCAYHGAEVADGIAILYKAVDDDYATANSRRVGIFYTPGSEPTAPDWDPEPECGGGLHFTARPTAAKSYNPTATRFIACPVALADIVVHSPASYPDKVKAPRLAGPAVEVDIYGEPVAAPAEAVS